MSALCLRLRWYHQAKLHVQWTAAFGSWSSGETRSTFQRYFQEKDHLFVPSSSVIPSKNEGTYFTNAGMNQFKPLFLGTVDPKSEMAAYKRVVNSQKCIRVGGKHNDLEEVGQDLTHHTFFEMLGNWSFGNYFKAQACEMALELLTSVYRLPMDQLYFTYFGGCTHLNLQPDIECRDIWRSFGIPSERILPFGTKDNFWDMGDTGPCGPCTEIHFDHVGARNAATLVNADSPEVVEIWNLVFMQFQRHEDGSLSPLPQCHVDTGMGLERILAVLNGSRSNYNTDLFQPLFSAIQKASGAEAYRGRVGPEDAGSIDTAYRILADHARMCTVAITDGLMPSKTGLGHKMRQLMYRCVRLTQNTFGTDPHLLCDLVDHVAVSLGGAFPEILKRKDVVKSAVAMTVEGYLTLHKEARHSFTKLLKQANTSHLTGEMMWQLNEGRYGCSVPVDMILDLAEEHGVTVDLKGFEQRLQDFKVQQSNTPLVTEDALSQKCFNSLQQQGTAITDDSHKHVYSQSQSGYDFSECGSLSCRVVGLIEGNEMRDSTEEGSEVAVLLDRTCFYAEGGGQVSDVGMLLSENGQFAVRDVQIFNGYVLHLGKQMSGTLSAGDFIQPVISKKERVGCMQNHTATHLLQAVLRQHLGSSVSQQGSTVRPDRLTFDFLCLEKLTNHKVKDIEKAVQELIGQGHRVQRQLMSFQEAMDRSDIITVANEEYPSEVTLVQVGDTGEAVSRELCGGTHVLNTKDIGGFCITRVSSVSQGVRRIFAITGARATEAHENGAQLKALCDEFSALATSPSCSATELMQKSQQIKQMLSMDLLPHADRDHAGSLVETLAQYVAAAANREKQTLMRQAVESVLMRSNSDDRYVVHCMKFEGKQMVKALSTVESDRPLVLVSSDKKSSVVVMLWPQDQEPEKVQAAFKATIAKSNPMKMKYTVTEHGAAVIMMTIKGPNLSDWLETTVKDVLHNLCAR